MTTLLAVLAQDVPDPEDVTAGWVGAALFFGLAAALVVLAFSFRKQLRKARDHFEPPEPTGPADSAEPTGPADGEGDAGTPPDAPNDRR